MNILQLTTTVLGGLALFIYGMGLMSEGLTQVAGDRMKAILAYVTRSPPPTARSRTPRRPARTPAASRGS